MLCQISRKSLYTTFLKNESRPNAFVYVRRPFKLESAYSELKNNEHIRNVTQVALKYAITYLGRFSAQYRKQNWGAAFANAAGFCTLIRF